MEGTRHATPPLNCVLPPWLHRGKKGGEGNSEIIAHLVQLLIKEFYFSPLHKEAFPNGKINVRRKENHIYRNSVGFRIQIQASAVDLLQLNHISYLAIVLLGGIVQIQ